MKRAILNFRAACLSLVLAGLSLVTIPAEALKIKTLTSSVGPPASITLEAKQGGNIATQWIADWRESDPMLVTFRWSTTLGNIQSAQWQVLHPIQLAILSRGNAGPVPAANGFTQFNIDFRNIAGATKHRPLKYVVRVLLFSKFGSPGGSNQLPPSPVVKVSFVGSGPTTDFNLTGLRPELLYTMPLTIDLETLEILDGGNGQEPYLLALAVFADGTTIKPEQVGKRVGFPNGSVRILSAQQTHKNITSDSVDENEVTPIPPPTGHFETTVRPIGVQVIGKFNLDATTQRKLRETTFIGVLVVGVEEGSAPSTDVTNDVRDQFIVELQTKFDNLIRSISVPVADLTDKEKAAKVPDQIKAAIIAGVRQIRDELEDTMKKAALAKTKEAWMSALKLPGGPQMMLALGFGLANHDDFVGLNVAFFTYQRLLDAGEAGIPFNLDMTNIDNDLHYLVRGRARLR
jgi:hypothetical protein